MLCADVYVWVGEHVSIPWCIISVGHRKMSGVLPYSLKRGSFMEPGSGLEARDLNDPFVSNPHSTGV